MIKVEVGKDKTSIEVVGTLKQILCETGVILKGIYEAVRRQDERAGEIYKNVLVDEDLVKAAFHLLEVDKEETIPIDINREELLKALSLASAPETLPQTASSPYATPPETSPTGKAPSPAKGRSAPWLLWTRVPSRRRLETAAALPRRPIST